MEIIHIFPLSPTYGVQGQPKNPFVHYMKSGLKVLPFSSPCMQNIFKINYS